MRAAADPAAVRTSLAAPFEIECAQPLPRLRALRLLVAQQAGEFGAPEHVGDERTPALPREGVGHVAVEWSDTHISVRMMRPGPAPAGERAR